MKTICTSGKSSLGEALSYLMDNEPYLKRYPEDGRLEIDNNRAERSIKPFVMSRKNFLFANTPGGAQSSAVVFSLIQTATENAAFAGERTGGMQSHCKLTVRQANIPGIRIS